MYTLLVSHSIKKIKPNKYILIFINGSKIELYISQDSLNLLNNNYINKYKLLNIVKNKCLNCIFFKFCKTNCLLYKKNECDKNMYMYNIEKLNIKKIRSNFIDYFSFILKDKSLEKVIKEYQYIAYAKNKSDKVISCVLFKEYLEFPYIWQLGRISTNKKFYNKGIASSILKIIYDFIISKKGKKLLVYVSNENKIAQKFYIKNGFIKEAKISKMKLGNDDLFIYSKEF